MYINSENALFFIISDRKDQLFFLKSCLTVPLSAVIYAFYVYYISIIIHPL